MNPFLAGKESDVVSGLYKGQVFRCEADAETVMGVPNIWQDSDILRNPAFLVYMSQNAPTWGKLYYGKIGALGFFMHESWLRAKEDAA